MSMWADYKKEREGCEVIETEKGFVIYSIHGQECFVQDVYVKPEFRGEKIAAQLTDSVAEIAESKGCSYLSTLVDLRASEVVPSMRAILNYGFKPRSAGNETIAFIKNLGA